jgi:hypothetical protein
MTQRTHTQPPHTQLAHPQPPHTQPGRSQPGPRSAGTQLASLNAAETQLRQCLVASKNRRDMKNPNPNFPDTQRLTIAEHDFESLKAYFQGLQQHDDEFKHLYPVGKWRFEVASSGSQGHNRVYDLKISGLLAQGSGSAIFNYHIQVQ